MISYEDDAYDWYHDDCLIYGPDDDYWILPGYCYEVVR